MKIQPRYIFLGVGLLIASAGWYFFYATTADLALRVNGEVLKVRTHEIAPGNVFVMADFRVRNTSSVDFMLRDATVFVTLADGKEVEGRTLARNEVDSVLQYVPAAGVKFNQVLAFRDLVRNHVSIDRMVGATFTSGEADILARRNLRVHLLDVEGKEFDLIERKPPSK